MSEQPTWVRGIGPPLEQIRQDAIDADTALGRDMELIIDALKVERAVRRQLAEALRALVEDVDDELGWGGDGPTLIVARGVLAASDALDEEEAPR